MTAPFDQPPEATTPGAAESVPVPEVPPVTGEEVPVDPDAAPTRQAAEAQARAEAARLRAHGPR